MINILDELFAVRGYHDARTKIAFCVCLSWWRLEACAPALLELPTPQLLLDEVEVACGLRSGESRTWHPAVAEAIGDWKHTNPVDMKGTGLLSREVRWDELGKLAPLTHDEVKALRYRLGLSPEAFGAYLGVSRQRVYAWEDHLTRLGTHAAHPTVTRLLRLFWPPQ